MTRTTTIRCGLGVLAAATAVLVGLATTSTADSRPAGVTTTRCEDLPHLWSGAGEIDYEADARTVTFVWDHDQVTMRDTDRGCASQPGLEAELRGNRDGWLANRRAGCAELRNLVDAVKAERRAQGGTTRGIVAVSDQAAEAAARQNPLTAPLADSGAVALKTRAAGQRTIDLDYSDAVLARCPGP